jgi:hypothetical protein
MKIYKYDPEDMSEISSDATGVDFGDVIKGHHAPNVVAIKTYAYPEDHFTSLAMFLESNGGLDHTVFGKYKSSTAITGIEPGDDYLSDYFVGVSGISDPSQVAEYSDYGLILDAADPEYVWIDAEPGTNEVVYGSKSVNFRFIFEYE